MAPLKTNFTIQNSLLGLGGVVCLSVVYVLVLWVYRLYFHPLARYPGPKVNAVSQIPFYWNRLKGDQSRWTVRLHKQYGDVVRIAPNYLSFTDAEAWKDIYGFRHGKPEMDKHRPSYSRPLLGEHIIIANREDHSRFRKNLSQGFSDSSLRQQEPLIQNYVNLLIQGLKEHSQNGPQNMCSWYNWTTFDIIGDLTFGEAFGCLKNSQYTAWVRMVFDSIKAGIYLNTLSAIPFGDKVAQYLIPKELAAKREAHYQTTVAKVNYRLNLQEERPDFLGYILKRKERGFTYQEFLSNSNILIIAGSETTATALSGATYLLLKNPEAMAKLVHEIRSSFKSEDEITVYSTATLKYLMACLEETLRVYPPVPVGFPRVVPKGGDFVAGKWVPGGAVVGVDMTATYRSPANFYDPDSFRPERFLGDPRFANDNRNALNPFSFGPRNCLGKNLAWLEMRLILARVLFNFDLELAEGSENWIDQKVYAIWEKNPLNVKLKEVVS